MSINWDSSVELFSDRTRSKFRVLNEEEQQQERQESGKIHDHRMNMSI
jgi:hypothetical protein